MSQLILSLFPGGGLLDYAFELEGFTVVRGPDPIWGGDIKRFHGLLGRFDGIIGGPPCQAFSRLRHIVEANGYQTAPDLIPEFERIVREVNTAWWVMENVPAAPLPRLADRRSFVLDNHWLGETPQGRVRRWTSNLILHVETPALVPIEREPAVTCDARHTPVAVGGSGKRKSTTAVERTSSLTLEEMCRLQGLPEDWLNHQPWTMQAKRKIIGNGVPIPMGRAIARAVRKATE